MSKLLKQLLVFFSILSLFSCQYFTQETNSTAKQNEYVNDNSANVESISLEWLGYADAKAEANFAIEKQDFHLLALSSNVISIPSIDLNIHQMHDLEQQCGIKFVADSDNNIGEREARELSEKLYSFAAQYNQLVFAACKKR